MAISDTAAKNTWTIIWALLPLTLGGLIYIMWRPESIRLFGWLNFAGLGSSVESLRNHSISVYAYIPEWIIFSLPNGMWAFSYAFIVTFIWSGSRSRLRFFWLGTIPVLGLGYELLQYSGAIRGVFCIHDLILCLIGIVLGTVFGVIAEKRGMRREKNIS